MPIHQELKKQHVCFFDTWWEGIYASLNLKIQLEAVSVCFLNLNSDSFAQLPAPYIANSHTLIASNFVAEQALMMKKWSKQHVLCHLGLR